MQKSSRPHLKIDRIAGQQGWLHDAAYFAVEEIPIPAPEFRRGLSDFLARNKLGHLAYLLGEIRRQGWWYFFPVVLLFKTPIPFLLLSSVGIFFAFKNAYSRQDKFHFLAPIAAAVGILGLGMLGHVNNGLRQVLSLYPLLSIVAGYGAAKLISGKSLYRGVGLGAISILLSWHLISSFSAHPNYLAYFNELAGNHPENIVVDSDLDWGQDLKQLSKVLKERNIKEITLQYNGSAGINLDQFHLPARSELKPYQKTTGWIAISLFNLQLGTAEAPYN
jgi:hypothetical protein